MVKLADFDKEAEKQEDEIEGAQKDYRTRTKMDKSKGRRGLPSFFGL